jgi:TPR repeat protein
MEADTKTDIIEHWKTLLQHVNNQTALANRIIDSWDDQATGIPPLKVSGITNWFNKAADPRGGELARRDVVYNALKAVAAELLDDKTEARDWVDQLETLWNKAAESRPSGKGARTASRSRLWKLIHKVDESEIHWPRVAQINMANTTWYQTSDLIVDGGVPPFVERSEYEELSTQLEAARNGVHSWERHVLVHGEPNSGKTRLVLEALTKSYPHSRLLIPLNKHDLDGFANAVEAAHKGEGKFPIPTVVLLDDVHASLSAREDTIGSIQRIANLLRVVVITTGHTELIPEPETELSKDALRQIQSVGLTELERRNLHLQSINVRSEVTQAEFDAATAYRAAVTNKAESTRFIGASCANVTRLRQLWDDVHRNTRRPNPARAAVLDGMLDIWFYTGGGEASADEVYEAANARWEARPGAPVRLPDFPQSLEWTSEPDPGYQHRFNHGVNGIKLNDTVARKCAEEHHPLDRQDLTQDQHLTVGNMMEAVGRYDGAEQWWHKAANLGNNQALRNIGFLRKEKGDLTGDDGAEHWWGLASEAGSAQAMGDLGVLRHQQGDLTGEDGAEHWYRKAIAHGDIRTMFSFGVLRREQGDLTGEDGADHWYREAIAHGNVHAMSNLGNLRREQGDLTNEDGAEHWYREAIAHGNAQAMYQLAVLRREQGDLTNEDGAEHWYREAIAHGNPDAMNNLGTLRKEKGDLSGEDGAEHWYREAIAHGNANAIYNVARLREDQGDLTGEDGAEHWYREAATKGIL